MTWYLMFNVIEAVDNMPYELKEVSDIFGIKGKIFLSHFLIPALLPAIVTGSILAFGVNALYNVMSGNAIKGGQFASSLSSDMLWYRLLPSGTNPLGILPATILVSAPLVLIILIVLRRHRQTFHPLRLAGIFTAITILLAGGLVVSIKIGGGSDLHNLDAYFLMLTLCGGYFYFHRWTPEFPVDMPASSNFGALVLVMILPIWFILQTGGTLFTWNHVMADKVENTIRTQAEQVARGGGEVLFISQRHLLALKMVDVPLIPAYEQDYLMEMAMSHNQAYLDQFQSDLRQQRFAMIVAEPQSDHLYQREHNFSEENNLWVLDVSQPILCYYELENLPGMELNVSLYIPRSQPCK